MSEKLALGLVLTLAFVLALGLLGVLIEAVARLVRRLAGRGLRGPSC